VRRLLRSVPFFEEETPIATPDGISAVRPYQVVIWISIAARSVVELPANAPRFPAVLDTGLNHNLSIRQEQMEARAGISSLMASGQVFIGARRIPLLAANVWIHRNRPGRRDDLLSDAFKLELAGGIAVYPRGTPSVARLPTLGLRSLVTNRLRLAVDGARKAVSLATSTENRAKLDDNVRV
jgi:hypothetical protein